MGESRAGGTHDDLHAERAVLASGELTLWVALRRVDEGGVGWWEGSYYHHGRAVPEYLNAPFAELVKAGWLVLAQADPDSVGPRRVMLTEHGRALYAVLCGKSDVCPVHGARQNGKGTDQNYFPTEPAVIVGPGGCGTRR